VSTVQNYKTHLGKSGVDQMLLVPAEFQHLVWWLFPSQVQSELQHLKHITFELLDELTENS